MIRTCPCGAWALVLSLSFAVVGCQPGEEGEAPTEDEAGPAETGAPQSGFEPVPLPDPGIPGFSFPEPEATIDGWVAAGDSDSIHSHTWGIWTALTSPSGQPPFEGQELLVFETWFTPQDIKSLPSDERTMDALRAAPREPRPLTVPHQLQPAVLGFAEDAQVGGGEETVLGFVKYDPSASAHVVQQDLFSGSVLNTLLADGEVEVPPFPATAVALKPVFMHLAPSQAAGGRYYQLPAWPGPPDPPEAFPSTAWGQCVWVDLQESGQGTGTGAVDTTCAADGGSRTPETTYGLGTFINFRLTGSQAEAMNRLPGERGDAADAAADEVAVLVGMHVTSREITRWAWQTFWWAADPDAPNLPSSAQIAALRPSQLQGAPRHYAGCAAYQMLDPAQPITGGSNTGESVYCFNPWLEAGFDPTVLPASEPGTYMGQKVANNVGVQTNCMSCHAMAAWDGQGGDLENVLYTGDRYVDLEGSELDKRLRLDFLWSIANNATPSTGQ